MIFINKQLREQCLGKLFTQSRKLLNWEPAAYVGLRTLFLPWVNPGVEAIAKNITGRRNCQQYFKSNRKQQIIDTKWFHFVPLPCRYDYQKRSHAASFLPKLSDMVLSKAYSQFCSRICRGIKELLSRIVKG